MNSKSSIYYHKSYLKMLFIILFSQIVYAQNAEEILRKSDETRSFGQESKIHIVVETYEDEKLSTSELMDVYNKGNNKSLVKLTSRKGQLVLMVDDNMWIYFPKTRKPMRITPFQRLMGQASNGDIANLSYAEDYTPTLLREETVLSRECYVLELVAKSRSSTYRKVHYWVDKKNFQPIKADYFMISGKHFKSAFFENYKNVNGKTVVGQMRLFRVGQEKDMTIMKFMTYEKKSLSNKYFSMNYLRNVKL